jgi:hypothetical protein
MTTRFVVLIRIAPRAGGTAELRATDPSQEPLDRSTQPIALTRPIAFILTLESEPDRGISTGQIRSLTSGTTYPLRSSAALLDLLVAWTTGGAAG